MKVTVCLLALIPLVLTGPAKLERRYIPEERDPDFKRYVYVENVRGELELIDLRTRNSSITPRVEVSDVEYDLYTRNNPDSAFTITNNNVDLLSQSSFDPQKRTIIVSHGWNNNRNSKVNTLIKDAIFINYDINLLIVDWSGPANSLYLTAKDAAIPVGQIVGDFITQIQLKYGLDGSSFVLIGHSLGAHVAGSAGATLSGKLELIIGLDPAGPLYSLGHPEERLDITDAKTVQVIHTDGILLGFGSSIGHVDYYPNGGLIQPGCGLDLTGTCSHGKAYRYMAEALSRGASVFEAHLCENWDLFEDGGCSNNKESEMGAFEVNTGIRGDYFLTTNPDEPYGQS